MAVTAKEMWQSIATRVWRREGKGDFELGLFGDQSGQKSA